jgi:GTP pyrophosphokinase
MSAVSGKADKNKMAIIHVTVNISNTDHLRRVVDKIKGLPDIYSVRRVMH